MIDPMDRGVFTIIALIIFIAIIGYVLISLELAIGIVIGVVVALVIFLVWPGIIELFI